MIEYWKNIFLIQISKENSTLFFHSCIIVNMKIPKCQHIHSCPKGNILTSSTLYGLVCISFSSSTDSLPTCSKWNHLQINMAMIMFLIEKGKIWLTPNMVLFNSYLLLKLLKGAQSQKGWQILMILTCALHTKADAIRRIFTQTV